MTTLAGAAWFLDEDDLVSDSATKVSSQQAIKAYIDALAVPVFTESFVSAAQTITSAGALVLAHGLSVAPTHVQVWLKCVSTANNYAEDDEFPYAPMGGATTNQGVSIVCDATNINVRFGSATEVFSVNDKTTGATAAATNSNYNLIVKAWA
jgi:hypothetical protein